MKCANAPGRNLTRTLQISPAASGRISWSKLLLPVLFHPRTTDECWMRQRLCKSGSEKSQVTSSRGQSRLQSIGGRSAHVFDCPAGGASVNPAQIAQPESNASSTEAGSSLSRFSIFCFISPLPILPMQSFFVLLIMTGLLCVVLPSSAAQSQFHQFH